MANQKMILELAGHEVTVSNPGKVYFPRAGVTKLDMVRYYLVVAPGALGGVRSLWHSRQPFEVLGVHLFPGMMGLPDAYHAFDEQGRLTSDPAAIEKTQRMLPIGYWKGSGLALALDLVRAWRVKPRLNAEAMHEAARALIGRHDFSTFRDSQCQAKSPIRTLDKLDVTRDGDEILIEASALSFLHRQVRSMVGSLVEVGVGRSSRGDLKAALDAADRARCGPVAPAFGLYLARVDYAENRAK